MLSFNLESASHTLCIALSLSPSVALTRSVFFSFGVIWPLGFSVTMPEGRRVSDRHRRIENAEQLTCFWLSRILRARVRASACFHWARVRSGRAAYIMRAIVKQNREWEGWESETKKEGMQTWSEDDEGKGHARAQKKEHYKWGMSFFILQQTCCYNHLCENSY